VERTTEELLPAIYSLTEFDEKVKSNARSLLSRTDLVKFARHTPTEQEAEHEYREAVEFINETREKPVPPAQAA